jgi:hypothetical protein
MNRKTLFLIVSVSVIAAAAAGSPAQATLRTPSAHATPRAALVTTTIKLTTFNSSFHLSAKTAPRGVVIFEVTNGAVFGHNFSINGHTTRVLKTGESATLRVTFLNPGHYMYAASRSPRRTPTRRLHGAE